MRARSRADGLYAIVLAAGGARRLGLPKQLIEFEGQALVRRCVDMANAVCGTKVIVVLGAAQHAIRPVLTQAKIVPNPEWRAGISTSLRAGLRALPADARGALLMLADQALLQVDSLARLTSAWRQRPGQIAAARYGGCIGAPAIFPERLFADLLCLRGDRGAKQLLHIHAQEAIGVSMPEAAFDLDTEADLAQLRAMEARSAADKDADPACDAGTRQVLCT